MPSHGAEQRVFQPEQSEFLSTIGCFPFDIANDCPSLFLPGGQFVGFLNEPNIAGWSATLRQNYGPVVARYIKLDGFSFRVRVDVSQSPGALLNRSAGLWRGEFHLR
jgi:hypothetical protein